MAKDYLKLTHVPASAIIPRMKNFSGKPGDNNPNGLRSFCITLDPDLAAALFRDGWNIKIFDRAYRDATHQNGKYVAFDQAIEPDGDPMVQVAVSYRLYAPDIWVKNGVNYTQITEDTVSQLDNFEIAEIRKLVIDPSYWERNGKSGIKAYLKEFKAVLVQDEDDDDFFSDMVRPDTSSEIPF